MACGCGACKWLEEDDLRRLLHNAAMICNDLIAECILPVGAPITQEVHALLDQIGYDGSDGASTAKGRPGPMDNLFEELIMAKSKKSASSGVKSGKIKSPKGTKGVTKGKKGY